MNKKSTIAAPPRVLHIITRMIVGGAQENTMLTARFLDRRRWRVEILCGPQTGPEGSLHEEVADQGTPLTVERARFVQPGRFHTGHGSSAR